MAALAQNIWTFRMPNCDGRVCLYAAAFGACSGEFSAAEVKNCSVDRPLSYIFNYVGQYGGSFTGFFLFIFAFFPVRFLSTVAAVGSRAMTAGTVTEVGYR